MSSYLQPLYDALRGSIGRAWPDVVAGGVFEAEHASVIPWADLAPNLPIAAIVLTGLASTDLGGMCNQAFLASVDIYRLARVDGPSGNLLPSLEALRDDLYANPLTYGQFWPDPLALSWNDELTPNRILASKQIFYARAGRLSITVLVGDAAS